MEANISEALTLLGIGMITVFLVLFLVVGEDVKVLIKGSCDNSDSFQLEPLRLLEGLNVVYQWLEGCKKMI